MNAPTLSAYISAWNLLSNQFDYQTSLNRALAFFDEVVVAVNTSTDDTLAVLQAWAEKEPRLKIVSTSFAYADIEFDGKVKDVALQACTGNVLVQLDLDEYIPLSQRELWRACASQLLSVEAADCFMIPTIDLWGSTETLRADTSIGMKFRIHKRGLHRGVWKEAWNVNRKHFDTSKSDSCELLRSDGTLAHAMSVVPHQVLHPAMTMMLNGYPFTVHTGYLDFDQRIRVNKAIWAEHWELRSGHKEKVAVDKAALLGYPLIKHQLKLT